ncbi:MAG: hypothetical protein WAS21_30095 [Geminicoccaceae bacterium]
MQATVMFSSARDHFARSPSTGAQDGLQADYRRALREAVDRAERAERRLRARVIELTWPAALSSLAGGFMAIIGLRLAGW